MYHANARFAGLEYVRKSPVDHLQIINVMRLGRRFDAKPKVFMFLFLYIIAEFLSGRSPSQYIKLKQAYIGNLQFMCFETTTLFQFVERGGVVTGKYYTLASDLFSSISSPDSVFGLL